MTAPATPTATTPATPHRGALRVAGTLTEPVQLYPTAGGGAFLLVQMQPAVGLPYEARVDLGPRVEDHMLAEYLLPAMRPGAVVSVCGDALQLRQDHGRAVLRVLAARDAVLFIGPAQPHPTPTTAQEGTTHAD